MQLIITRVTDAQSQWAWLPVNVTQGNHVCSSLQQTWWGMNKDKEIDVSSFHLHLAEITLKIRCSFRQMSSLSVSFTSLLPLVWTSNFVLLSHFSDLCRRLPFALNFLLILTFSVPLYHLLFPRAPTDHGPIPQNSMWSGGTLFSSALSTSVP